MLVESITYQDELPFALSFLNVGEENKHCHEEIEILLVLRGVTHYRIYHMDYELNPGDLIIADVQDLHQIYDASDDILMLSVHVDTKHFESMYPNIRYMFFVSEECMEGPVANRQVLETKLSLLKQHIARLAMDYTKERRDLPQLMKGINELVAILVEHFQGFYMEDYQYKVNPEQPSDTDLQRLCRITRYILQHYNQKITLDDVSGSEHLNSYYVSHLIKKILGFNFQNFVNAIRLEFAEKQLLFSNLTLMQVSQECGFSSPNYFNKCFSAWYGKTPAQYRKEYRPKERTYHNPFTREEAVALLMPYLNVSRSGSDVPGRSLIRPDFGKDGQGYRPLWEMCAPRIRLESLEDLIKLGYHEEEIRQIRPACFLIDKNLKKKNKLLEDSLDRTLERFRIPAVYEPVRQLLDDFSQNGSTVAEPMDSAEAFRHIFAGHEVTLSGAQYGLFSAQGLRTPVYHAYAFFAKLTQPEICIHREYALIRSEEGLSAVVWNTGPVSILDVRFAPGGLPERFFVMQTELTEQENCGRILHQLDAPKMLPERVKQCMDAAAMGRTQFSRIDRNAKPQLHLMVYHNTAVILELIPEAEENK